MRKCVPSKPRFDGADGVSPGEQELDALLGKVEEKKARKQNEPEEKTDTLDVFRARMRQEYIPVFDELAEKYSHKGLTMDLDVDELLGGGTTIKIRMTYGDLIMELDGTASRGGVAFYIIRGTGTSKGAMVSGPMLRIRNLEAAQFRQFLVDHLGQLIKDALRQT